MDMILSKNYEITTLLIICFVLTLQCKIQKNTTNSKSSIDGISNDITTLTLLGSDSITIHLEEGPASIYLSKKYHNRSNYVWIGNSKLGQHIIICDNNHTSMRLFRHDVSENYILTQTNQWQRQVNASPSNQALDCIESPNDQPGRENASVRNASMDLCSATPSNNPTTIDILMLYTHKAMNYLGGSQVLAEQEITMSIAEANLINLNTGINLTYNLKDIIQVSFDDISSLSTTTNYLQNASDGVMDSVADLRCALQADLVSLVVYPDIRTSCGNAKIPTDINNFTAKQSYLSAFSTLDAQCMVERKTMAHEFGHNLGLRHALNNYSSSGSCSTPSVLCDYFFGAYESGNSWLTVMTRADFFCQDPCSGCLNSQRLPYFSDPNQMVNWNGSMVAIGDALSNNAKAVKLTMDTIARYSEFLCPSDDTLYVDHMATGSNNGTSWTNAYNEFYSALNNSLPGETILVSQGTYKPNTSGLTNPRNTAFIIPHDKLSVFGGFNTASGTTSFSERNPSKHPTILSADIGTIGDNTDNTYHVIFTFHRDSLIFNGLTFTGGYADGTSEHKRGGGLFLNGGQGCELINCQVINNYCTEDGGGILLSNGATLKLKNTNLQNNTAVESGGGIAMQSNAILNANQCSFKDNSVLSSTGAGAGIQASQAILNLTSTAFIRNTSDGFASALSISQSVIDLFSCYFFKNNSANTGGAGYIALCDTVSVTNCTFVNNSTDFVTGAGGLHFWDTEADIANSIFYGNGTEILADGGSSITVLHSLVQGGFPGIGILDTNPLLVDTAKGDLNLLMGSPCINTAGNDNLQIEDSLDYIGNPRTIDAIVDMGAYEHVNSCNNNTWVGSSSGNWFEKRSNWSEGVFPTDCQHVIIPSGKYVTLLPMQIGKAFTMDVAFGGALEVCPEGELDVMTN